MFRLLGQPAHTRWLWPCRFRWKPAGVMPWQVIWRRTFILVKAKICRSLVEATSDDFAHTLQARCVEGHQYMS